MDKIINWLLLRKRFFFFSFLRITTMALSFISTILIVRKLSVTEYGVFSVILMIVNLFTTFGFSWSSSSIIYYGSKEKEIYGSINRTFWVRNILIFISLLSITIGLILFRNQINNYIGLNIWLLLLLWLYVKVLEDYLNYYFLAIKKQVISSVVSSTVKIIYILLLILVPFDLETLIVINIISNSSVIFFIWRIDRKDIGKFNFDRDWFKQIFNFSVWQLFGFSGIYLLNFGDTAVIKHYMSDYDVGLYNAAYQLFNAVASFSYVISSYFASNVSIYFSEKKLKQIHQFYYRDRFFLFSISLVGHLILIIISKPVIVGLYGSEYIKSVPIFCILMMGSIVKYFTVFYMLYYNTNGKHKMQQLINIFSALINVLLSIVFINLFGLYGPAIATVITLIISFLYSFFYCEKRIMKFSKEM